MKDKTKDIIQTSVFGLTLLPFIMVLLTVLIINDSLAQGNISGKYFWFYLSMGGIMVATLIGYAVKRQTVPYSHADLFLFIFMLFLLPGAYLLREFTYYTKEVLVALLFVLYICLRVFSHQYRHALFYLTLTLLATGLIEAVWGLCQLYGFKHSQHHLFRLTGSLFNPGPYGGYLAVCMPMAVYYLLKDWEAVKRKNPKRHWPFFLRWGMSALTAGSILLVLPATMSRAAWIGALGGSILTFLLFLRQDRQGRRLYKQYRKKIRWCGILLLTISMAALIGIYFLKKDSADGRFLIWKISLLERPYPVSPGIGSFPAIYGDMQERYFKQDKGTENEKMLAGSPEYAFNEYIQMYHEQGIFAFAAFLLFLSYTFYRGVKNKQGGAIGSLTALFLFAGSSYPFSILPFPIVLVFLLASCNYRLFTIGYMHSTPDYYYIVEEDVRNNRRFVSCVLAAALAMAVFCLYDRLPTYQAYRQWVQTKLLYQSGMYQEAAKEYQALYPLLNDQSNFLFEYGRTLHQTGQYEESNLVLHQGLNFSNDPMFYNIQGKNFEALGNHVFACHLYWKAIHRVPHRLYPHYLLAKAYEKKGNMEEARRHARIVVKKEPKVPSMAVEEMKAEMKKLLEKLEKQGNEK